MTPRNNHPSDAEHKAARRRICPWLRKVSASRIRVRRREMSLRTELILLLCALVLLATASLGSIAYTSSRAIIEGRAVREVGTTASARK
jgi:hypothetical protein